MLDTHQVFSTFLHENDLFLIPLQSIKNGSCTCGQADCHSPGKHPLLKWNWKHVATNDKIKIDKWLNKPDVNFGIATGRKSTQTGKYLIVVDIDAPEHEMLSMLPPTFSYRTGSGGWHFWYWSKYKFANSVSKLANKVDIRGNNGYVVVPPSKHISGQDYTLHLNIEIADIPSFIIERLCSSSNNQEASSANPITKKKKSILTPGITELAEIWTKASISDIRSWMASGNLIPEGARNTTVHRLLSSDRAKGLGLSDLEVNARLYTSSCESSITSSNISTRLMEKEIVAMLSQIIKYKTYNTSYEKVHTAFFDMMKKSKTHPMSEKTFQVMVEEDVKFFSLLKPSTNKRKWMTLSSIYAARNEHMKEKGFEKFSKYPLPLLASKLRSLGFERSRTARQNVWNIEISRDLNGLTNQNNCVMINRQIEPVSLSSIGEPLAMTMKVEDRTIKLKVRKHPSEGRYCGRENQELGSALLKLLAMLEPHEKNDLLAGQLIVDEEGSALDFDQVQVGDRVGIAIPFEDGWVSTLLDISSLGTDEMKGLDAYTQEEVDFTFEDASTARAMGYFEILYRPEPGWDGTEENKKLEPFGVDKEESVLVRVITDDGQPDPAATPDPNAPVDPTAQTEPAPATTSAPALAGPTKQELDELAASGVLDPEVLKALAKVNGVDLTAQGPAVPARAIAEDTDATDTTDTSEG
ncbi:MAG: bifunctional DNA primase/polymerase [Candidatus Paceibacterota bacterium]|jgi:putative DNA primase/helicase